MRVRIGKRIGDLFEECGGFSGHPFRIAVGSPFSGRTVRNLDEPVTKNSYAVFAMLKSQTGHHPARDCICCGECRRVCPVGLDPEELYKRIIAMYTSQGAAREPVTHDAWQSGTALRSETVLRSETALRSETELQPVVQGAEECHGCGCCELVCPSSLPLSDMIMGKIRGNGND